MTTYYITFLAVFLFSALAQKADRPALTDGAGARFSHTPATGLFFFIAAGILICVSGLRYNVGTDFGAYYRQYHQYAQRLRDAILGLDEPGYPLIAQIAIWIYDNGTTAVFLAAMITIGPALRVIYRHTDRLLLAAVLFIFLGCWDGSFNGVRQYLAATVLFCGYQSLETKHFWKYLLFVLLAFLFHRSVIVMAVLYFAAHRRINVKNILLLTIGTIVLFLAYDRMLEFAGWITEHEYSTENAYASTSVNILRVLAGCAPAVVFQILLVKKEKTPKETFHLNLLTVHAAIRIATMSSALLYRVGIYTTLFQAVAIPELLKSISPRNRKIITFFMVVLLAIFWWYEIYNSSSLNDFHFIWER